MKAKHNFHRVLSSVNAYWAGKFLKLCDSNATWKKIEWNPDSQTSDVRYGGWFNTPPKLASYF